MTVKERPILFNGEMVRAILAGTKTQTRRPIGGRRGPPQFYGGSDQKDDPSAWGWSFDGPDHSGYLVLARGLNERHNHGCISVDCAFGAPGDRLWVRETYYCDHFEAATRGTPEQIAEWREHLYYRADVPTGRFEDAGYWGDPGSFWKPSIHMPRWASRLTLRVTDVRVERVQDITEADARAEGILDGGCLSCGESSYPNPCCCGSPEPSFRDSFAYLWADTYGPESWTANPWVWVVSFEVER